MGRLLPAAVLLLLVAAPAAVGLERDPQVAALAAWLEHEDPVLRALAAFELRRHAEAGAVEVVAEALAREADPLVQALLLRGLDGRPRADLVLEGGLVLPGLLLRFAGDPRPVLHDPARRVLARLPLDEAPSPDDLDAWRRWWLTSRAALAEEQGELASARAEAEAAREKGALPTVSASAVPEPDLYEHVERLRRDGLDLVITLDHTGSMAPVIGVARARAASLVRRLAWLIPGFRAGLVTYDDAARLRLALTPDGAALAKALGKVGAGGGADWEEGVDKAIALALRQERLGWSRRAHRVIVVIGDAPPHGGDVERLLRSIRAARDDVLYEHAVTIHTVSATPGPVDHFGRIAAAGGGRAVVLDAAGALEEEIVALAFGAAWRDRVRPWLDEIERLRKALGTDAARGR